MHVVCGLVDCSRRQAAARTLCHVPALASAYRLDARTISIVIPLTVPPTAFPVCPCPIATHVTILSTAQIVARVAQYTTPAGYLPLIALSAKWEQNFAESIVGTGDERSLAMQPSRLSEFITSVRERFEDAARQGEAPVLVTSPTKGATRYERGLNVFTSAKELALQHGWALDERPFRQPFYQPRWLMEESN